MLKSYTFSQKIHQNFSSTLSGNISAIAAKRDSLHSTQAFWYWLRIDMLER